MPKPFMFNVLTSLSLHAALVKMVLITTVFLTLPADRQLGWGAVSASAEEPGQAEITFERDVMAVLSKAGCNAGTCHGNVNGKGGFFLSLRGQDPSYDYRQLVRSAAGRRVDSMVPAQSLALLKATAEVAHQGGKRFARD